MVRHSTRQRKVFHKLLREKVQGVQFLYKASDFATGVTPKEKRQKTALVKMKLKEFSKDLQQTELKELNLVPRVLSLHRESTLVKAGHMSARF